jgi:hypothetical protein
MQTLSLDSALFLSLLLLQPKQELRDPKIEGETQHAYTYTDCKSLIRGTVDNASTYITNTGPKADPTDGPTASHRDLGFDFDRICHDAASTGNALP